MLVVLVTVLSGCRPPSPSPASTPTPGAKSTAIAPVEAVGADGLVVAVGGQLLGSDVAGRLTPLEMPGAPVTAVSAGAGRIAIRDRQGLAWLGATTGPDASTWRELPLRAIDGRDAALIALAPAGDRLAVASGNPQGLSFGLTIVDVPGGRSDPAVAVDRGLNGPPVWLGAAAVAVNVIGRNQRSGFAGIDVASGTVADIPSFGFSLSATADGTVVAFDESGSGDVLVGARSDMKADGLVRMTRIPSPAGTGPDAVALSPDGTRLAIVRRTGSQVTIEVLVRTGAAWTPIAHPTIQGELGVSLAWLR